MPIGEGLRLWYELLLSESQLAADQDVAGADEWNAEVQRSGLGGIEADAYQGDDAQDECHDGQQWEQGRTVGEIGGSAS